MFPISPGAPGSGDFSNARNLRSLALDQCKTKQNFVVSKWGKGDSYVGGLDVSLKN